MEQKNLFTETQKFRQWWIWILLLSLNGVFLFGLFEQVYLKIPFGDKPSSNEGLLIGYIIILTVTILFWVMKLETQVREDGIYVKFFPIHLRFKKYDWEILRKAYVRRYSPIYEYGGWGIRLGLFGSGNAYNISGNKGLQLEIIGKSKLLIGTQKPEALQEVLMQLKQYKP
jgi:hypothetical protein